jgi:Flp pilus assembly pilin Flp
MTHAYVMITNRLKARGEDDRGASMVEYGLLVAPIALAATAGAPLMGTSLSNFFGHIVTKLDSYFP